MMEGLARFPNERLEEGSVLAGRYEVVRKAPRDAQFLAADKLRNNQLVDIEQFDRGFFMYTDDLSGDGMLTGAFVDENVAVYSKCVHPGLQRCLDYFTVDERSYVVMEHIEGERLDIVLKRDGAQHEEVVRQWMLELCDVVGHLHTLLPPVFYRDINPACIVVRPSKRITLLGRGLINPMHWYNTFDCFMLGSPGYQSPELNRDGGCARSDVYQLGAVMWSLIAGELTPWALPLEDVRVKRASASKDMASIIEKCTQLDPAKRYKSCKVLARKLRRVAVTSSFVEPYEVR